MLKNIFITTTLILMSSLCHAFTANNTSVVQSQQEISSMLHQMQEHLSLPIAQKLEFITKIWLNRPYQIFCLGEGDEGEFDQRPIFRTDAFDCETFIDMSLALAYAKDFSSFETILKNIRYKNGKVDFTQRNHFTNIDWNYNNEKQNYLKDITLTIQQDNHPIAVENKTLINKKQWYALMKEDRIFLNQSDPKRYADKLQKLRKNSEHEQQYISKLYYIPIKRLFNQKEQPIKELIQQIPHGAILELVSPQSNTEKLIGTDLDITHLGFVFHINGEVYFRHASYTYKKVVNVVLADYLKGLLHHKTIKGIHIEMPQDYSSKP